MDPMGGPAKNKLRRKGQSAVLQGAVKARNTSYKYLEIPIYRIYNPIYNKL